jgi:hypothetical protein
MMRRLYHLLGALLVASPLFTACSENEEVSPGPDDTSRTDTEEVSDGDTSADTTTGDTSADTTTGDTSADTSPDDTSVTDTSDDTSVADTTDDTSVTDTSDDTSVTDTSDDTSVTDTSDDTSVADTTDDTSGDTTTCIGPDGCFLCPDETLEFLNQCTDSACQPFDNVARLPLYADPLPPLP